MNSLRLYFRYVGISVRAQMQYRASFVMMVFGHFAVTGIEILGIWALFGRFGSLAGWTLPEVALLYGMVNLSFALAEMVPRSFDNFPILIKSGDFDTILLRPRSTALQVAGREIQLMRIGRMAQGGLMLFWGAAHLGVAWGPAKAALLAAAVLGGGMMFSGLFILQATMAFWTVESLEIANTVTYGGNETGQYPLAIYRPWFRKFFTFVVPLGCVNYFPGLAIMGKVDPLGSPVWFQWVCPVVGFVFLVVCLKVWEFGVRHYRSTGN